MLTKFAHDICPDLKVSSWSVSFSNWLADFSQANLKNEIEHVNDQIIYLPIIVLVFREP